MTSAELQIIACKEITETLQIILELTICMLGNILHVFLSSADFF